MCWIGTSTHIALLNSINSKGLRSQLKAWRTTQAQLNMPSWIGTSIRAITNSAPCWIEMSTRGTDPRPDHPIHLVGLMGRSSYKWWCKIGEKQRNQKVRRHEIYRGKLSQHEREKPRATASKHFTTIGVRLRTPTTTAYKRSRESTSNGKP
jgi:hypothetical protein